MWDAPYNIVSYHSLRVYFLWSLEKQQKVWINFSDSSIIKQLWICKLSDNSSGVIVSFNIQQEDIIRRYNYRVLDKYLLNIHNDVVYSYIDMVQNNA